MKHVVEQMKIKGYFINNIDINIITQTPKIKNYKRKMIENIAKLCEISKPHSVENIIGFLFYFYLITLF